MTSRTEQQRAEVGIARSYAPLQAVVLLPLAAAIAPVLAGSDPGTTLLCIVSATIAALALANVVVIRHTRAMAERQQVLEDERSAWESRALTDPLTGLPNRRGIAARADHAALMRPNISWTVLTFDVDRFKAINDFYGHSVGDRALVLLADTLADSCPEGAWVGRLGGDEFIAFSDDPDVLTDQWANEFRRTLAGRSLRTREGTIQISLTVGRSVGAPGECFDLVSNAADESLILRKGARRASTAGVIGLTDADLALRLQRAEMS